MNAMHADDATVDLMDDREYAWLLVRSGTVVDSLARIWRFVPIRQGSMAAAAVGFPLRLLLVVALFASSVSLTFLILVALAQVPVAIFVYARPLLSDEFWLVVLCGCAAILALYLAFVTGVWLQAAARGQSESANPIGALSADVLARPVAAERGWNRWDTLHVGHESARAGLFAGISILLGLTLQCLAAVAGAAHFAGPVDVGWRWPLTFGEQLVTTALLGIPEGNVPILGGIEPVTMMGRLLFVGIETFFAAGVIGLGALMFTSLFKVRELFNGTTRDLADYLENFDLSRKGAMMIHRVAVVRPLDEDQCVSLTKERLFEIVRRRSQETIHGRSRD